MIRELTPEEKANFSKRLRKNMDMILNKEEPFVYATNKKDLPQVVYAEEKEDLPQEVKNMVAEKVVTYRAFKELEDIGELKIELTIDENFDDLVLESDEVKLSGYAQLLIRDIIKKHEMG